MLRPYRFLIISACAITATITLGNLAYSQSPSPNPQYLSGAVNAVVAQRERAENEAADAQAKAAVLSSENDALKKQVTDLEKQVADLQNPKDQAAPKETQKP